MKFQFLETTKGYFLLLCHFLILEPSLLGQPLSGTLPISTAKGKINDNHYLQIVEMLSSLLLTWLGQSFRQMWECNLTLCLEGSELEYWRSCKYIHIPFLHHSLILGVKVRWSYSYIGTNYNCQKVGLKTPITVSSISITTYCCFCTIF